jgi:hypothetical protein
VLSTHPELTADHTRPSIPVISLAPVRPHVARRRPRGLCKTPGVGNGNSCPEILRNLTTRRIK